MSMMGTGASAWRRFGSEPVDTLYWNPLDKANNAVLSDSNKVVGGPSGGSKWVRSVTSKMSGKWRAQFVALATATQDSTSYGFALPGGLGTYLGSNANGFALWGTFSGGTEARVFNGGILGTYNTGGITNGSTIDILLDINAGKAWWQLNGIIISGDPVAGTGAMATFTPGSEIFLAADPYTSGQSTRLRTNPAEITGASVAGFTNGWPV